MTAGKTAYTLFRRHLLENRANATSAFAWSEYIESDPSRTSEQQTPQREAVDQQTWLPPSQRPHELQNSSFPPDPLVKEEAVSANHVDYSVQMENRLDAHHHSNELSTKPIVNRSEAIAIPSNGTPESSNPITSTAPLLTTTASPGLTMPQAVEQLYLANYNEGLYWKHETITYGFPTSSAGMFGLHFQQLYFSSFSEYQKFYTRQAMDAWDDLIDNEIVEYNDYIYAYFTADIELASTSCKDIGFGSGGYAEYFDYGDYRIDAGSIWIDDVPVFAKPRPGTEVNHIIMHEIGHTLGLNHMGQRTSNGVDDGLVMQDENKHYLVSGIYDSNLYSIMSYIHPSNVNYYGKIESADWIATDSSLPNGYEFIFPQTPMLLDILAIQKIYGASTTTRRGNTTYGFNSNITYGQDAEILNFDNNPYPIVTILDNGGYDCLDLSGWNTASRIDLQAGHSSDANDMTKNIWIAFDTIIENAVGGGGNDSLTGNDVDNVLRGGMGNDRIYGLSGNDYLNGDDGNDLLVGGAGQDLLDGGSGDDQMSGNTGDDWYYVNSEGDTVTEAFDSGLDTIWFSARNYVLPENVENINLGGDAFSVVGNSLHNKIIGTVYENDLSGEAGSDYIEGNGGNDTLDGGLGNDLIYGGSGHDSITGGADHDRLYGGDENDNIEGNDGNDYLDGGAGSDILQGGNGSDTLHAGSAASGQTAVDGIDRVPGDGLEDLMFGGNGDDTYIVLDELDLVQENSSTAGGIDTVNSYIDYVLGNFVENLNLQGAGNSNGTGNSLRNRLYGNSGNNSLLGLAGNDYIYGRDGNDTIDGGLGSDTMAGGDGDDVFYVDSLGDIVYGDAGIDTVIAPFSYTLLGSLVENLTLTGSNAANGIGSTSSNTIIGNSAANNLVGDFGDDMLIGNQGGDTLDGGDGNDTLNGGAGVDKMIGGSGNDTYYVDNIGDMVIESYSEYNDMRGKDTVISEINFTLSTYLENLKLIGPNALIATGNQQDNKLTGNEYENMLIGNLGNDTLKGGASSDTYRVSWARDGRTEMTTILDTSGSDDTLILSGIASASNLRFSQSGVNLLIWSASSTELDSIMVFDWYEPDQQIEHLKWIDNTGITRDINNSVIPA